MGVVPYTPDELACLRTVAVPDWLVAAVLLREVRKDHPFACVVACSWYDGPIWAVFADMMAEGGDELDHALGTAVECEGEGEVDALLDALGVE